MYNKNGLTTLSKKLLHQKNEKKSITPTTPAVHRVGAPGGLRAAPGRDAGQRPAGARVRRRRRQRRRILQQVEYIYFLITCFFFFFIYISSNFSVI